jgi:riboflavin synthase
VGRRLHLEPSLRVGDAIDGHLVLGHVDGTGRVARVARHGGSVDLVVHCGEDLARWLMPKGSVAVDGVSLTVDEGPHVDRFTVNLVPHTLRWTTLGDARPDRAVNLEMDVLVKAARSGRTAEALGAWKVAGDRGLAPAPERGTVPSLASILDRGFDRRRKR